MRTRRFTARLPRYVVAALQCLAEENGESADALLTRELHGLAYAHRERHGCVDRGVRRGRELAASGRDAAGLAGTAGGVGCNKARPPSSSSLFCRAGSWRASG